MLHPIIPAEIRTTFGKKNNALRRNGHLPIKVTGLKKGEAHLTISARDLELLLHKYGRSTVFDLKISDETSPVMLGSIQLHPVTHRPLHAEFHKVNLKQKTHAPVEIKVVGEAPIVKSNDGVLTHLVDNVSIEALPDDMPAHIDVDISNLEAVGAEIKVSDLPTLSGVTYLDEPEKVLLRIVLHKQHKEEPELETTEPELVGEAGEEPTEGESVATTTEAVVESAESA